MKVTLDKKPIEFIKYEGKPIPPHGYISIHDRRLIIPTVFRSKICAGQRLTGFISVEKRAICLVLSEEGQKLTNLNKGGFQLSYAKFCRELKRLFDIEDGRYKAYWDGKVKGIVVLLDQPMERGNSGGFRLDP